MYKTIFWTVAVMAFQITTTVVVAEKPSKDAPHIVLVLFDDMGFSDLGCYGGEIRTPHIDALAAEGLRFTQFKNAGRCCPSRAALLSGRHQHAVGLGFMTYSDEQLPGYRGQLTDSIPTIAELLKQADYGTYLAGKWHVTLDSNLKDLEAGPNGSWPVNRGFDQSYGSLTGPKNYWKPKYMIRSGERITEKDADYYFTTALSDQSVDYIEEHDPKKPMFLYLAHYAPHTPLQAPEDRIEACRKLYEPGYDALREARFARLQQLGFFQQDLSLPTHAQQYKGGRPSWDSLSSEQQENWIINKATYAAMVEIADDGIGALVTALKQRGMYDNTVFLFLSDNGSAPTQGDDKRLGMLGGELSNTPFRSYKADTYYGGIRSPLIVRAPGLSPKQRGQLCQVPSHITDILPTCLDWAKVDYPDAFNGEAIPGPDGVSLVPAMAGADLPSRAFFFQHGRSRSIISENWKAVRVGNSTWTLYDLNKDPFETIDIASEHPERLAQMSASWQAWAVANHVLKPEQKKKGKKLKK
ncbi:MAG: arylsulfatase [Verrucomicrobiota bacterium]